MPHYRLYQFNAGGHIVGADDCHCVDDTEAFLIAANACAERGRLEVWHEARMVARVPRRQSQAAPESIGLDPAASCWAPIRASLSSRSPTVRTG
jgi:hypothetical protein